jgi:hypothetical protein
MVTIATFVLAGRATSVPFTAVLTGPEQTATDNTTSGINLRRSPMAQLEILPDLALQAGSRLVEACIGLAVPARPIGPGRGGPERRRRPRPDGLA